MNAKYMPYSILVSIILLEVLSVTMADSPWPWAILFHGTLGLKILGWYLAIQSGLGFLYLLVMKTLIPDKGCPICNKDLKTFIPVFGKPVICPKCRTWFHKNCLMAKNNRCPICYPETPEGTDIPFDFTSGFPRTSSEFDG